MRHQILLWEAPGLNGSQTKSPASQRPSISVLAFKKIELSPMFPEKIFDNEEGSVRGNHFPLLLGQAVDNKIKDC
ncbi:hypothetical protein Y1Q_0015200 [Alligator mississippiensis]|uniref:Uncharacterized protein n=1 Tax=Alligator mississippiensis TaxID=8496 RepID=A0A151P8Z3_ALLMI|nr:hypothetical protein Y1Q_0015200 [Alligator mississippiensis]